MPSCSYTFNKPWPKGVVRRDVRVFKAGQDRHAASFTVSPPTMTFDLQTDLAEGDRVRLEFRAVDRSGRPNKEWQKYEFTIPDVTDIDDDAGGELAFEGETVPETAGSPADLPTVQPSAAPDVPENPAMPAGGLPVDPSPGMPALPAGGLEPPPESQDEPVQGQP